MDGVRLKWGKFLSVGGRRRKEERKQGERERGVGSEFY